MSITYVTSIGFIVLTLGILFTRYAKNLQYKKLLETRLSAFADKKKQPPKNVMSLLQDPVNSKLNLAWLEAQFTSTLANIGWLTETRRLLSLANWLDKTDIIVATIALLFFLPLIFSFIFDCDFLYAVPFSLLLASLPIFCTILKANANRRKFIEQLPQAIDLMVSVLRSGFSVPQAVKAVADELAYPAGDEFTECLQRMNFGQSLSQAFVYSCEKFRCYELDLIRRAVAIQAEIGGSLAELMDKTNDTLKDRLKLVRRVDALTAQSKLTALIVGLLPFVLAIVLSVLKPGYLSPLFTSPLGKTLLTVAVVLLVLGLILMKKLSTVRI